jgi:hypothetical protein
MKFIVGDFETRFGKGYSLRDKGMTHQKYIMDERFKAHGCGLKIDGAPARWIPGKHLEAVFAKIDWSDVCFIGHNLGFDASILAWRYGIYPKMYVDTLALARAQIGANAIKHGLDALGELLLGSGKPEGLSATYNLIDLPPHIEEQLGRYCEDDCEKTYQLFKLLMKGMTKTELLAMDWCARVYLTPKFMLDQEVLAEYLDELAQQKADALASVGMVDRKVLNSSEQFAEALRSYGMDPPTKMGKPSKKTGESKVGYAFAKTDQAMKDLLDHPNVAVQALVAARLEIKSTNEENKAQAYYESAQLGGAWPVSIKYAGAMNTQRFSGDKHGGGNPQNLGRGSRVRDAICAPEGYKIMASDLAQIEARISLQLGAYHYLWNRSINDPESCPEMDALDKLRNNEDIYCWFGSMIYGRTITKADVMERQLSKTAVLGLCFGMGAKRFFEACREKGLTVTMEFAKIIVKLYRKTFPNVVKSWKASLRQLSDLMQGVHIPAFRFKVDPNGPGNNVNAFNILDPQNDPIFDQPAVRMPNGQYLKYPMLTCEVKGTKTEWSYWNKGNKAFIHPGKTFENCIAHGTDVLTERGWVPIQEVRLLDRVHDGVEFVSHGGMVYKSVQSCTAIDGVYMTPDHEVLSNEGCWLAASENPEPFRPDLRGIDLRSDGRIGQSKTILDLPMHMRTAMYESGIGRGAGSKKGRAPKLRMSNRAVNLAGQYQTRSELSSSLRCVGVYARSLQSSVARGLQELRGAWDQSVPSLEDFRFLLGGHAGHVPTRAYFGAKEQRARVFTKQLPMGDIRGAGEQPTRQRVHRHPERKSDSQGSFEAIQYSVHDSALSTSERLVSNGRLNNTSSVLSSRPVYDIINCGPRTRFVVRGEQGPFIVHNCVQALAGQLCREMLVELEGIFRAEDPGMGIELQVHDELVALIIDDPAWLAWAKSQFERVMQTAPAWMPELPVACETKEGYRYGECH